MRRYPSPVQDSALAFIRAANRPVTTDEVRRHLRTYLQAAQSVLAELVRKGLVEKVVDQAVIAAARSRFPPRVGPRAFWTVPVVEADSTAHRESL